MRVCIFVTQHKSKGLIKKCIGAELISFSR